MIKAASEKVQGWQRGHRSPSAANGLCFGASAPGSDPHPASHGHPDAQGLSGAAGKGGGGRQPLPPGPEQEGGEAATSAEQQQRPGCRGHRRTRDRGQALSPSLPELGPRLLRQQGPHNLSCEDSTSPASTILFCESVLSVQALSPQWLGCWEEPIQGARGWSCPGPGHSASGAFGGKPRAQSPGQKAAVLHLYHLQIHQL